MTNNQKETVIISSDALAVEAPSEMVHGLLYHATYNKPHFQDFLDEVGTDGSLHFSAWFVGQWAAQQPEIAGVFKELLNASIQIAGDMQLQHARQNPGFNKDADSVLLLYPGEGGASVVELDADATGTSERLIH